jgi:basic membrane protein A
VDPGAHRWNRVRTGTTGWRGHAARTPDDKERSMRRISRGTLAAVAAGALILSACGGDGDGSDAVAKACLITDTGGIDDKSFNETAWNGLVRAQSDLDVEVKYLESTSEADYEPNIKAFVDEGCDIIVTVGFLLGDATEAAAIAYPDVKFAIVDYAYAETYPNLLGLVFATEEAGFLAGYASAAVTETGIVGTWGGINIPPVSAFMQGYLAGVNYHNAQKGTSVSVIGWDGSDGVFIGSFEAQDLGNAATRDMLQNGADVVMPVAGPAGLGAGTAIQDFGKGKLVWVDTDGYFSTPFAAITFTSVEKRMDNAVFAAVKAVVDGNFAGGVYEGTIANDGVGISPFHDFDGVVSAETKAELDAIRQGIVAGTISTTP